jgi:Tetratricopeptide repeat.
VYPDHEPSKIYLEKISQVLDEIEQQRTVEIARWVRKGNVALARNNVFEARRYFDLALEYDPENQEALEGQGKIDSIVARQQASKSQVKNKNR